MKPAQFILTAAALLLLAACSEPAKPTPAEEAVNGYILRQNPSLEYFNFTRFTLADSVSFGQELERRERLFGTKITVERASAAKYERKGMPTNAAKHRKELQKAQRILRDLGKYRKAHEAVLDSVIYYIYEFDGYGYTVDNARMQVSGMQAAVSPQDSVYQMKSSEENVCAGMGRALPGYIEILKSK